MSDRWTATNILKLFRPLGDESGGAPISPEVSNKLTELFEAPDLSAVETSQQISDYLKQFPSVATAPVAEPPKVSKLRWALRRSASVLSAFDPSKVKPTGLKDSSEKAGQELFDDIVEVYDPPTPQERWMLEPMIRADVLREFGTKDELIEALNANPDWRPATVLQRVLESYIHEQQLPMFDLLPQDQLAAHLQAVRWLEPTSLNLPKPEAIQEAIDQREVPAVFSRMAGQNFIGREKEMSLLRDYVEVLPASSNLGMLHRQVRRWLGLRTKPPLVIYGPGGVGKTTLISRFLLDHMEVPEDFKFPYVYLDFDNPRLSASDSNSILTEAVRQLSIQYASARSDFEAFLRDERGRSSFVDDSDALVNFSAAAQEEQAADSLSRFAQLVDSIIKRSSNEGAYSLPLLIVLDTYEEVQYRGLKNEIQLWNLLDSIQNSFPTLRVVIFGRAPLDMVPTSSLKTQTHALSDFDQPAGVKFLQKLGIENSGVAGELYDSVGGNPLSLKLAAQIYNREGTKTELVKRDWLRSVFFFKTSEVLVQGQLYQRILNHIHDQDVRKIAHPGLVLRRITADLIKEVLAKPCGISVPDKDRANELFEAFGREVALVTRTTDGVLVHRPDLRQKMLEFIERDKPSAAEKINRLAVDYYSKRKTIQDRAEEIYHRLKLGEVGKKIETLWRKGVEPFLRTAIQELPVESRPMLASYLGITISDEDIKAAGTATWERYTAREAEELVKLGHYTQALDKIKRRKERTKGSPLYRIEATALVSLKRFKEAEKVMQEALKAAAASGRRTELLDCVFLAAEISQQLKAKKRADDYLKQAVEIAAGLNDRIKQILAVLHRLRLNSQKKQPDSESVALKAELATLLGSLTDTDWVANKRLVRASVSMLGPNYSDIFIRMLRRIGIGTLNLTQHSDLVTGLLKLQQLPSVKKLTQQFASIADLPTVETSDVNSILKFLLTLQVKEKLDQFLEKLVPLMLEEPDISTAMWNAFASLFKETAIEETKEA